MPDDKRTIEEWLTWARAEFQRAARTGLYGSVSFEFRDGNIVRAERVETTKDPRAIAPAHERKVG